LSAVVCAGCGSAHRLPADSREIEFLRNGHWWMMHADGTDQRRAKPTPPATRAPGMSPDGVRMAFGLAKAGKVVVANAGQNSPACDRSGLNTGGQCLSASWSPRGNEILYESGCDVDLNTIGIVGHDASFGATPSSGGAGEAEATRRPNQQRRARAPRSRARPARTATTRTRSCSRLRRRAPRPGRPPPARRRRTQSPARIRTPAATARPVPGRPTPPRPVARLPRRPQRVYRSTSTDGAPGAAQHPVDMRANRPRYQTGDQDNRGNADAAARPFRSRAVHPATGAARACEMAVSGEYTCRPATATSVRHNTDAPRPPPVDAGSATGVNGHLP
jgi:hypothetical protein